MGLFKESLDTHIRKQFEARQEVLALGENRSGQMGGAFHAFTTNKYCNMRMASCVDIVGSELLDLDLKIGNIQLEGEYSGPGLARSYILQGGLLLNPKGAKRPEMRRGFPGGGRPLGGAYGDPLARAEGRQFFKGAKDGYGIVPMPGITKMNIRTKSAYGSLREAKVDFVCHNLRQLALLELLYMRPGYPIMLEWQWTPYIVKDKNGIIKTEKYQDWVSDKDYFWGKTWDGKLIRAASQVELYDDIHYKRKQSQGNYDGIIGLCKNFSYSARPDGGFNCTTELMSIGETISTVKGNVIEYLKPTFKKAPGSYGGNRDNVAEDVMTLHMPVLLDLLEKTHDYRLNETYGFYSYEDPDGYATDRNTEARTSITNGDNNSLGDDDDEYEVGAQANRSAAYQQNASIRGNGWWNFLNAERVNIYNIKREDMVKLYQEEFLLGNTGNPFDNKLVIKEDIHMIQFKEGRSGWQDFLLGAYIASLGPGMAVFGPMAVATFKQYQDNKLGVTEGYIRLDALCYMINKYVLPTQNKNVDTKLNTERINAFQTMHYNPYKKKYYMNPYKQYEGAILSLMAENLGNAQALKIVGGIMDMSTDPYVCLMPKQVTGQSTAGQLRGDDPNMANPPVANNFGFNPKHFKPNDLFVKSFPIDHPDTIEASKGSIGHIMVNLRYLLDCHDDVYGEEGKRSEDYSVGKFMDKVIDGINKTMAGNIKLGLVTDNDQPGVTSIVDLNQDPQTKYEDIFTFNVLSNDSAVRNFSFNSAIPSAMASTIAVGAGDPDNADSLDAVTFAAMNRGLKNRLFQKQVVNGQEQLSDTEIEESKKKMKAEFQEVISITNALYKFQLDVMSGEMFQNKIEDSKKEANIKTQIGRLQDLVNTLSMKNENGVIQNDKDKNPPASTPIPIKLDMTFDGIAGLTMGQLFRVDDSRLPQAYRNKNIIFVVVAEDQSVDDKGNWTTKISGQMQLFPSDPSPSMAKGVLPNTDNDFDPAPYAQRFREATQGVGRNLTSQTDGDLSILLDELTPSQLFQVGNYWDVAIDPENNLLYTLYSDLNRGPLPHEERRLYNRYASVKLEDGSYALQDRMKNGAAHDGNRILTDEQIAPGAADISRRYGAGGTTCFVAGTKVTMADKTLKNIENIKEGDEILSYNVSTKEFGIDKVLPLPEILGNYQKIIATYEDGTKNEFSPAHPFYVDGKGWASYDLTDKIISTGDCGDGRLENEWNVMFKEGNLYQLEVGDYCVNTKGKKLKITSLEKTNEHVDMYNLEHLSNNKT